MTNNMMTIKSKAMLGKREITVTHHLPEGQKTLDMIAEVLLEYYIKIYRKLCTDDEIEVLFPVFHPLLMKGEKLRKSGYEEEEIRKILIDDLKKEIEKKSEVEQKNINAAIYYVHQRQLIREGKSNNGK